MQIGIKIEDWNEVIIKHIISTRKTLNPSRFTYLFRIVRDFRKIFTVFLFRE